MCGVHWTQRHLYKWEHQSFKSKTHSITFYGFAAAKLKSMGILFRKGMLQILSCPSLLERIHIQHTRGSTFRRKSTFENDHGEQKLSCERDTAPEIIEGTGKEQTASKLPTSAKCTHTLPVVSITRPSVKRSWERCMWAQLYDASQQRPYTRRQGWIFPMKIEHKTHRLL